MSSNRMRYGLFFALIALALGVTCGRADAAFDMFLKLEGVQGSSQQAGHAGEIDLLSVQYGLGNSGAASIGSGAGAGKVQFSEITITKKMDKSSPQLLRQCLAGKHIKTARLTCRKAGKTQQDFYRIDLTDVLISGYSTSSSGELPTESLSLNFTKVAWEYLVQKPDGSLGPGAKGGWDVVRNTAVSSPPGASSQGAIPGPIRLPILTTPLSSQLTAGLRSRSLTAPNIFAKAVGIEGESTDSRHPREIEIHSFSWGVTNTGSLAGAGGGAGKAVVAAAKLTKALDKASVPLMLNCASGKHIPEVQLVFVKPSQNRAEYLKIKFSDVLVGSFQQSGAAGGDIPMESLSLNFTRVECEFFEQNASGALTSIGKVGFDLKQGTTI